MERMFFIVNPAAGCERCGKIFEEKVEPILKEKKADYGFVMTEYPFHAITLAEEALKNGEKFIVAVGGDGTINEVSSVLCGKKGIKFGILPFGTGNDIADTLKLPLTPNEALDVLFNEDAHDMDMGSVNDKKFINIAGIGFDVDVLINVAKRKEKAKSKAKGMLPYFLGILDALFHRRRIHAVIETEHGKIEEDILLTTIGNGRRFGGGMQANPKAIVNDGLFDICVVEYMGLARFLSLLPLFMKGKHLGKKPVKYFRAKQMNIITDVKCKMELDGEIFEGTPAKFNIIPNALKMVCPEI